MSDADTMSRCWDLEEITRLVGPLARSATWFHLEPGKDPCQVVDEHRALVIRIIDEETHGPLDREIWLAAYDQALVEALNALNPAPRT